MQQQVLQQVLQQVVTQLTACNVRYMLSGSVAMSIYATPRFTRDLDIVVAIDAAAVDKLSLLWADQYYYTLSSIKEDIYQQRLFNITRQNVARNVAYRPYFVLGTPTACLSYH